MRRVAEGKPTQAEIEELATSAADLVWRDDPAARDIEDPFEIVFARRFIADSVTRLANADGVMLRALRGASRSAEGTNVDAFHGLVEFMQNADDLGASEVRIALDMSSEPRRMRIVHNGRRVRCQHVYGMMLPYITDKDDDADQRGRFGIGLKTLRRFATDMAVHSAPYHFGSGHNVWLRAEEPHPAIPGLYDEGETLVVLDLKTEFDAERFARWFAEWSDDGLIFLEHVRALIWHRGDEIEKRSTEARPWKAVTTATMPDSVERMERRDITAGNKKWTVYRAHVHVPPDKQRAYKRTGASTPISIASCGRDEHHGLFIGFRTRLATALPFALDAQFDPSGSRESIIENGWNEWLIARCGDVAALAARAALIDRPKSAWRFVPLLENHIGDEGASWPLHDFAASFALGRTAFGEAAVLVSNGVPVSLSDTTYETLELAGLLEPADLASLSDSRESIEALHRDPDNRWRKVVAELGLGLAVTPEMVIQGFERAVFAAKPPAWWAQAAEKLTACLAPSAIFGTALWLRADGTPIPCRPKDSTDAKIVFGIDLPLFSRRWNLFNLLHDAYASPPGERARAWLVANAAYSIGISAHEELLAFAEKHASDPARIDDDSLREMREMLDPLTQRAAAEIGARLGRAILIDAFEYRGGKTKPITARPADVYLPKSIDKDSPNWPTAAAGLPGMRWAANSYDERLRTGLGKAKKRPDGTSSRGARKFLSILGAASSPRLIKGQQAAHITPERRSAMVKIGATWVPNDEHSPDLDIVLDAITGAGRRLRKERRERAVALAKAISREWESKYAAAAVVKAEHTPRSVTQQRGVVMADWISRLRDAEWMPVGREKFRKPTSAALKNDDTQALYRTEDFVSGLSGIDLDDSFAEAIGLISSVRSSDLLATLEAMRDGEEPFDLARVRLAYQHFSKSLHRVAWPSAVGDVPVSEFRSRCDKGRGLVIVATAEGMDWRRPGQVLRGRHIFPVPDRYVIDKDAYRPLWSLLGINEASLADCNTYLREHAVDHGPEDDDGTLIEVYGYMNARLGKAERFALDGVRHVPLTCIGGWRAKRPILLVADPDLRQRLADARPDRFFWRPPCEPQAIADLVNALSVTVVNPEITPARDQTARERGEDFAGRFERAVDLLSDTLGRRDVDARGRLSIGWDQLRSIALYVHEGQVPIDVSHAALGTPVRTGVKAHLSRQPLELHVVEAAFGSRDDVGRAIASLFADSAQRNWSFDAEWVLAWQLAEQAPAAMPLQFKADDAEHAAKIASTAAQVAANAGGTVKLTSQTGSPQRKVEIRQLKTAQPGIVSVTVQTGGKPGEVKPKITTTLSNTPRAPSPVTPPQTPITNTNYTNNQLESFGWDVLQHVLARADGAELVDFRKRHGVGADGAFNWKDFVELKATGRSQQSSIRLQPSEYARAFEKGNDYILALVYGTEEGLQTRVKLIFDPVRRASVRETEGVMLSGLIEADGIHVGLGENGEII